MEREEAKWFAACIGRLREKHNLTMQQLSEGLCSYRIACYIEQGEREPDRLLREAMLGRLGVEAEDYECYLGYVEYAHWKLKQKILHSITFEETERAEQLLEEYWKDYCIEESHSMDVEVGGGYDSRRLERQFYFSMQAQIQRCCGSHISRKEEVSFDYDASSDGFLEEQYMLFRKALDLTVPTLEKRKLVALALSVKELNLILEAEHCRPGGERSDRYLEVLDYIACGRFDRRGMAKIYPKAVYFLCRCLIEEGLFAEGSTERSVILLRYCNRAIQILRDNCRMFFLWELLGIRERLLGCLSALDKSLNKRPAFRRLRRENNRWRQALEAVYTEFQVHKETSDYCYLYVSRGVNCINDVIRVRSKMLGIRGQELCEGICSIKTLRRIMKCTVVPHRYNARDLFERLGLSGELVRTELVTDKPKARELMEMLREHGNENRWEEVEALLEQIKNLVPQDIVCNKQAILRQQALLDYENGKIGRVEYCEQVKKALELTMPYEAFLKPGEKYLTREEQACIQNMMFEMDKQSKDFHTCMLRFEEMYQPFDYSDEFEAMIGMYEFIMKYVRSNWGNSGEYDKADRYDQMILEGCLRTRRLWFIHDGLYDRWWNDMMRKKEGIPEKKDLDDEEELTKCLLLGELTQSRDVLFYRRNLEELQEECLLSKNN